MTESNTITSDLSPLDRKEIASLLKPFQSLNKGIYWADMLISVSIGWGAFYIMYISNNLFVEMVSYLVAVFAFLRAIGFIHEISHQSKGRYATFMRAFRRVWNVIVGVPFMISSPFYSCHLVHHSVNTFGTKEDPQYLHVKGHPGKAIGFVLIQAISSCIMLPLRTLILVPLSLIIKPLRIKIEEKMSSIAEPHYTAKFSDDDKKTLLLNDVQSSMFWWAVLYLAYTGILPVVTLIMFMAIIFGVMFVNAYRILGEHTYDPEQYSAEKNSSLREFINSYNYNKGGLLIELLYNTGLRYHALHHYLPQIPYHNLPAAHRLLVQKLPGQSMYHIVNAKGHMANVLNLIRG